VFVYYFQFFKRAKFDQSQIIAIAVITRLPFALKKVNVDNLRSLIPKKLKDKSVK
jgi:phenylacetate-coenzyme A ligase PaaK-like adenylate-forming protein